MDREELECAVLSVMSLMATEFLPTERDVARGVEIILDALRATPGYPDGWEYENSWHGWLGVQSRMQAMQAAAMPVGTGRIRSFTMAYEDPIAVTPDSEEGEDG